MKLLKLSLTPFIDGPRSSREKFIARSSEGRHDFLRKKRGASGETGRIVQTVLADAGRPLEVSAGCVIGDGRKGEGLIG